MLLRRGIIKNKKGDATDPFIILVILFFLAVSFIVVIFVNTKIHEVTSTSALNETSVATSINSAFNTVNISTVQRGFVLMFALIVIFAMVSAFMIRVHPAFIFIYIFTLAIALFTAVFIGNIYGKIQDNPSLNVIIQQQVMLDYIMSHIVQVILAIGALSMVIVFSKFFSAPVGGGDQF